MLGKVEGRGRTAWVKRERLDAPAFLERDSEQDVGGLGLAVGRPDVVSLSLGEFRVGVKDVGNGVAFAADVHDPRRGGREDAGADEVREKEGTEMVRRELRFKAVDGECVGAGHWGDDRFSTTKGTRGPGDKGTRLTDGGIIDEDLREDYSIRLKLSRSKKEPSDGVHQSATRARSPPPPPF